MKVPQLYLASASPRRRDILDGLGISYVHGGVDLDETRRPGEDVESMVTRLASEKAMAVGDELAGDLPVLGADTVVVLGDRVFGKPASEADAIEMLSALSGRAHHVLTAIALRAGDRLDAAVSDTEVVFRDIRPDEAHRYWHSGEPGDKAGAYAIQGLGGMFVESISGSYSGVVGLPVFETVVLLEAAGLSVLEERG
jgi:septum formation protein